MKKAFIALAMAVLVVGCGDETTIRGYSDTDVQNMFIVYKDSVLQELADSVIQSSKESSHIDTIYIDSRDTVIKFTSDDSIHAKMIDSLYIQVLDSVYKRINVDSIQQVIISANSGQTTVSSSSTCLYEFELKKKASWKQFNPDITYGELIDERDGQKYKTVKIGNYTWMAENLNYADSIVFQSLKGGNSECYNDYEGNCILYGRLYSVEAVLDYLRSEVCKSSCSSVINIDTPFQGICPDGWHLPDTTEFLDLLNATGEVARTNNAGVIYDVLNDASGLLSESSWESENGTNTTGFSLLAGGRTRCDANSHCYRDVEKFTSFWILNYKFNEGIEFIGGDEKMKPKVVFYYQKTASMMTTPNYYTRNVRCVKNVK